MPLHDGERSCGGRGSKTPEKRRWLPALPRLRGRKLHKRNCRAGTRNLPFRKEPKPRNGAPPCLGVGETTPRRRCGLAGVVRVPCVVRRRHRPSLLSPSLRRVGHQHPTPMQAKVFPEALFERIGEPVELRSFRQRAPNPQNPPSPAPLASEAIRCLDFTDPELELRVVSCRRLDLYVPPPAPMTKLEIETEAVARVVRLSFYQRQNLQPVLRDPRVPAHDIASELRTQEAVGVDLADDAGQVAKICRWPTGCCRRFVLAP